MQAEGSTTAGDDPGRRRARRRRHLLRRLDRRRPRVQRDQLAGPPLLARAAPGAVGDALPDAARHRDAVGQRAARHPRRPLRHLLRAQHRLAHLPRARPAGRLRPERDRAARRPSDPRCSCRRSSPSTASSRATRSGASRSSTTRRSCRTSWGTVPERVTALDPRHPVTIGPYMNDPDLINNKYQLTLAMEAARRVIPEVFAEYEAMSGRRYPVLDLYRMDDADVALVLLNSAAETAKDVADGLREQGIHAGVHQPERDAAVPRRGDPEALRRVKRRPDRRARRLLRRRRRQPLARGQGRAEGRPRQRDSLPDPHLRPRRPRLLRRRRRGVLRAGARRGRDGTRRGAVRLLRRRRRATRHGRPRSGLPPIGAEDGDGPGEGRARTRRRAARRSKLRRSGSSPGARSASRRATARARAAASSPRSHLFLQGLEGDVVVLYQTGCAMVVTTGYPSTSHRITYVHNLFQNGAATLSGLVEMFHERVRRGELPAGDDITFVMITGDGGMDIGMGAAIGAAIRNHRMIILEYDNQGYMNTGAQLSYSTPLGHLTSTSHVGPAELGKSFHHKDTPQIMAASNIPYVFTGDRGLPGGPDAQGRQGAVVREASEGLVYGKILISCPLNWRTDDRAGATSCRRPSTAASSRCTRSSAASRRSPTTRRRWAAAIPVAGWLKLMGKTRHLLQARERGGARLDRGRDRAPLAAAQGDARAPTPVRSPWRRVIEKRRLTEVTKFFVRRRPAHRAQRAARTVRHPPRARDRRAHADQHHRLRPRSPARSRSSSRRSAARAR